MLLNAHVRTDFNLYKKNTDRAHFSCLHHMQYVWQEEKENTNTVHMEEFSFVEINGQSVLIFNGIQTIHPGCMLFQIPTKIQPATRKAAPPPSTTGAATKFFSFFIIDFIPFLFLFCFKI